MRLLHAGHPDVGHRLPARHPAPDRAGGARDAVRPHLPLHRLSGDRRRHHERRRGAGLMDLGTAFAFAAARAPGATAFVQGGLRLTYAQWEREIRAAASGLRALGLRPGDHLVVVMRNRREMATLYWAAHYLGLVFTPVSWRSSAQEIAYCLEDAEAAALAYDGASGDAAPQAAASHRL